MSIIASNSQDNCRVCGERVGDFEEGGYEHPDGQRGHYACDQKESFSPSAQQLAIAHRIMAHAYEHYDEGGWDVLVECFGVEDICRLIWMSDPASAAAITTFDQALADIWDAPVSVWADREADAYNSAG